MAEISISTINVADGREMGDTPRVYVQRPNRLNTRPADTVIAFFDLPTASAAVLQQLTQTLAETYQRAPGGVGTGLRLAMKLANEKLVQFNTGSAQPQTGSLTVAVVSGENCVLAQCGPSIAYARSQGGAFERIAPPARTTLFGSAGVEVYVANIAWQPSDSFVITGINSMSPDGLVSEDLIDACMSKGDGRMIAGYLNANVKKGFLTGIALTIGAPSSVPVLDPVMAQTTPVTTGEALAKAPAAPKRSVADTSPTGAATTGSKPSVIERAKESVRNAKSTAAETLKGGGTEALRKLATGPTEAESQRAAIRLSPEAQRTQKIALAAVALLLPILVAALVSAFWLRLNGDSERTQARNAVVERVTAANRAYDSDPANSATAMQEALNAIRLFEQRNPTDTAFEAQKGTLTNNLDTLLRVRRGTALELVTFPNENPRRVAGFDSGVYVLDPSNNTLELYALNAQRVGVSGKVDIAPVPGFSPTTPMRDVTWVTQKGGRWTANDGAIMASTDTAYMYDATNARIVPFKLPAAGVVPNPVAIDVFGNRMYQLDAANGNVIRYNPQADGALAPSPYMAQNNPAFREGIDLAVDGGMFVLKRDPAQPVVRAMQGAYKPDFTLKNLPVQLARPVALAVSKFDPEEGSLFVGDAASGGIYEFTKAGEFVKQHRAPNDVFVNMSDFSYDFSSDTFFVTVRNRLYLFKSN